MTYQVVTPIYVLLVNIFIEKLSMYITRERFIYPILNLIYSNFDGNNHKQIFIIGSSYGD